MKPTRNRLTIEYKKRNISISYFARNTDLPTLLYLHGLGCSKDDFLSTSNLLMFKKYNLVAFDFPGHGNSTYPRKLSLNMDDFVRITEIVVSKLKLNNLALIGHSMGGLIALLYTERNPKNVRGFVNVEGNLAPEDCFFSRKAIGPNSDRFIADVFPNIKCDIKKKKNKGFEKYASYLDNIDPRIYYNCCASITGYSDHGQLISRFLKINTPKIFVYGSDNRGLSYLPCLKQGGCKLIKIPSSNHWPVYDNPKYYHSVLYKFIRNLKLVHCKVSS